MAARNSKGYKKQNLYQWKATNHRGTKENGEIEADSPKQARLLLRQRGLKVTSIHKERQSIFSRDKVKANDIVVATRQLATLVEGGIPIAQSLTAVGQSSDKTSVKKLLGAMRRRVDEGVNLTTTLRDHPKHFNSLYQALINVGEESGTLGLMLRRIATYLEKAEALRRKVISALTYPFIVLMVGIGITVGLLIFIIPQFKDIFNDFGADLPMLTQKVIDVSDAVQNNWLVILVVSTVFYFVYREMYRRSDRVLLFTDRMTLRMPVFGNLIRKSVLARIARTIAIMFKAGIPMVETLATIAPAAGNQLYTNALNDVRKLVSTGQPLEASLRSTGVFPSMVLQMVRTGEETGELDAMLDRAADFYEDEVDAIVAAISSLVEPILIVVLGTLIGIVVVAMYLPIFHLASVF
ncbi:MAG: type II secretion system F family protein [Proteobacteria bacterium]|nr:type II secretion system F family protein [Pseudomonadota bacterium]